MNTARGAALAEPTDIVKALVESVREPLFIVEPKTLRLLQVNQKAVKPSRRTQLPGLGKKKRDTKVPNFAGCVRRAGLSSKQVSQHDPPLNHDWHHHLRHLRLFAE